MSAGIETQDKNEYDGIIYDGGVFEASGLAKNAIVARSYGLPHTLEKGGRVLELGCATGVNLFFQAALYPNVEFFGIDLSREQIKIANQRREALQAENVHFEEMDIMDFPESWGKFDFIIIHGVFSWIPTRVREKVLEIFQKHLNEGGFIYLDANAMPGAASRETMQRFMTSIFDGEDPDAPEMQQNFWGAVNFLDSTVTDMSRQSFAHYRSEKGQKSWLREQILKNESHLPKTAQLLKDNKTVLQKSELPPQEAAFIEKLEIMSKNQSFSKEEDIYPIFSYIGENVLDADIMAVRDKANIWFYLRHEYFSQTARSFYLQDLEEMLQRKSLGIFGLVASSRRHLELKNQSPYLQKMATRGVAASKYWQVMDILTNNKFHTLLITHNTHKARINTSEKELNGLFVCLLSSLAKKDETVLSLYETKEEIFLKLINRNETFSVTLKERDARMCFLFLLYRPWQFFSVQEIYKETQEMLRRAQATPLTLSLEQVSRTLMELFANISAFNAVSFRAFRGDIATEIDPQRPILCPTARFFIKNPVGQGHTYYLLYTRIGSSLSLNEQDADIAKEFDGTKTIAQVNEYARRVLGEKFNSNFVSRLLSLLQSNFLLITPAWNKTIKEIRSENMKLEFCPLFEGKGVDIQEAVDVVPLETEKDRDANEILQLSIDVGVNKPLAEESSPEKLTPAKKEEPKQETKSTKKKSTKRGSRK